MVTTSTLRGYISFSYQLHEATRQYSRATKLQLRSEIDSFNLSIDDFDLRLLDRIVRNSLLD